MPESNKKGLEYYADLRDAMLDAYAEYYKQGFRSQVIMAKMQTRWPEYSTRTILEMIKPIRPVQIQVKAGTWVPNAVKTQRDSFVFTAVK
jgi:hypothetical protein